MPPSLHAAAPDLELLNALEKMDPNTRTRRARFTSASGRTGAVLAAVRSVCQLWVLRPPVRGFYARALWTAIRQRDGAAIWKSAPPQDLAMLLRLLTRRLDVVELGTAVGWSATALALDEPSRRVRTIDPTRWPTRRVYLELVPPQVRERITFVEGSGADTPPSRALVDAVFVDTNHRRDVVEGCFNAWSDRLRPGGLMVFHDFGHPRFRGVSEAIERLQLDGSTLGPFFVWTKPGD